MTKYPYEFDDNSSIPSVTPSASGPTGPTGPAGVQGPRGERGLGSWTDVIPSGAVSSGTIGQFTADNNYIYVCIATDTWIRAAVSPW